MSSTFQQEVGEWGEQTFRQSTPNTICYHLQRETHELAYALREEEGVDAIAEEAADCYLLLLHLAHRIGFDLEMSAGVKFIVNKHRTWGPPDAEGVSEHVAEPVREEELQWKVPEEARR